MPDPKTCPTCAAPLPADATGGACPKCLLQAGFATGGSAPVDRTPTPDELAPKFPGLVIASVLGRGGMGVVYKARHKALDRDVALKVLPASLAGDAAFADRFQREARALAKLQHPNIVAVHDFGTTDGLFWLVMEYVDGANIRQAMKAGTIGPKEALAIVPQICDALQYAHEHGVVHRDIKPENILLGWSGASAQGDVAERTNSGDRRANVAREGHVRLDRQCRVKVADFGLAKLMEHGESDRTLTGAGQVMGTPHYMAPEQWEHPKDVDHRADIYSLGVVFYEMLTGELPVGRFAAPSKKSDVDARIDEIVLRTLEREREARYQRADEVKTDRGAAAASAGAPPPARHGSRPIGVTAIAAVLALIVGVFATESWRLEIAGCAIIVCVVQIVDWWIRRAPPSPDVERRRTAWLFGSGVLFVGTAAVLANTLDTVTTRHAAATLAALAGAYFLMEFWRLRHPRRTDGAPRQPMPGWTKALIVAACLLCGGPLVVFAFFALSNVGSTNVKDLEAANRQKQKDQEGMITDTYQARLPKMKYRHVPFELESSAADIDSKSETPGIEGLFNRFLDAHRDGDEATLLGFYLPNDSAALRAMDATERARRAKVGELGLPLYALHEIAKPLSRSGTIAGGSVEQLHAVFWLLGAGVTDVISTPAGDRIARVSAWATDGNVRYHFRLRGRVTDDATGRHVEWFFDNGHVDKVP
jgi:serine/threonine protein kinase